MRLASLLTTVLLAGCGGSAGSPDSGIRGHAVIASCGVPFSESECQNPPPYEGEIQIHRTFEGPVVQKLRSGPDGRFLARLEPGTYVLEWEGAPFPILKPVDVTVRAHEFTEVNLAFDSGIR